MSTVEMGFNLLAQIYANLRLAHRPDEQARKGFDQSLRLNLNPFNAWLGLGLLARKQRKLEEAISDLSRSGKLHPAAGRLELGRTFTRAGRIPEAREAYRQALAISPGLTEAQQAAGALPQ